ncbi:hypothetical protein [Saccharothrix australiensis]|uniref:hypothetical protein n=1 Tax=Saccharothrix australiensis TaxID=2072 RepID=UPI000EB2018D|nr:hypothetical protein [Saccharothrix australiensis]
MPAALAALAGGVIALTACAAPVRTAGTPVRTGGATSSAVATQNSSARVDLTAPTTDDPSIPDAARGWCTARDLEISAVEHVSPAPDDRLFALHFAPRGLVHCVIGGTLGDVAFAALDGVPLDPGIGGGQGPDHGEISVGDHREAVVYFRAPGEGGPDQPVATVSFTLPGKGTEGESVTVAWPSPFHGPLHVTGLMEPVG